MVCRRDVTFQSDFSAPLRPDLPQPPACAPRSSGPCGGGRGRWGVRIGGSHPRLLHQVPVLPADGRTGRAGAAEVAREALPSGTLPCALSKASTGGRGGDITDVSQSPAPSCTGEEPPSNPGAGWVCRILQASSHVPSRVPGASQTPFIHSLFLLIPSVHGVSDTECTRARAPGQP